MYINMCQVLSIAPRHYRILSEWMADCCLTTIWSRVQPIRYG